MSAFANLLFCLSFEGVISMSKLFEGYSVSGKILTKEEFKPFIDIKSNCPDDWSQETKTAYLKRANIYLEEAIPNIPATLYIDFRRTGNRKNFQDAYFKRRHMAYFLAAAETIEKKGVLLIN